MNILIKRGRLCWLVKDSSVIAMDNLQATCYHSYGSSIKLPIERLKKIVLNSKENELDTWEKAITLTQNLGIRGYGTTIKRSWFEES